MDFDALLTQITELLQRQGRVSYGALKRRFNLDDDYLQDLKDELINAQRVATDEDGKVLVWTGASPAPGSTFQVPGSTFQVPGSTFQVPRSTQPPTPNTQPPTERRQLTVMFCDLVGSTALSAQLDPEDLREVVRAYQQTCAEIIQRHDGYIAQYLGDGLLVYFGYPTAHEDDARRAVRTGLEVMTALTKVISSPLVEQASSLLAAKMAAPPEGQGEGAVGAHGRAPLQVRIGIHTGLVVIGDMGGTGRTEQLALGETPNIAARIQGLAEPNTVLISAVTQRLIDRYFESQPFGSHLVKGIDTPIAVYHVQSERQGISPLAGRSVLTPLVGREQEVGLLVDRWEQVKEGRGQVVLLSGEPGIGKSRLASTLREHVTSEGSLLFEARCSPYHQHSALYPLIESFQRTLLLTRQDTDDEKVEKLERALTLYGMQDTLPLFTALLSLPTPSRYPPLTLTPQKQKERTLRALLQLLIAQAERQATVSVWEDLHWADPSSLEFLSLLIDQLPTTKLLLVLTFRSEFTPPWKPRSHLSQLVLNRLGKKQVEAMIAQVGEGKALSTEVVEQIRMKTDGVPLFVEELTKSVVETMREQVTGNGEQDGKTGAVLGIPATLQEALLARLDRLSTARQIAQLGATLGREFSHGLLQAVAPISEPDLHTALAKLVEAEILYQRGVGEQARYFFKHALIQDTAYQSLLKSTRQQYHQQIAHVLEERFPNTKATQPELLAHHYTEANLTEQAIPYWRRAGQRAAQRSAYVEAISHFTKGLELLQTLPDTPERAQQELTLQIALGTALVATKGYAALETTRAYARARQLCQQVGETPQLFPVLGGLAAFYIEQGEFQTAHKLAEQLLRIAQYARDSVLLLWAHLALGQTFYFLAELKLAREHFEQSLALYDRQQLRSYGYAYDPGVACRSRLARVLWSLGYPDQALKSSQAALSLAQGLSHPFSLALALSWAAEIHRFRREPGATQQQAEALITLSTEQGFPYWLAMGTILQGWTLAEQGREAQAIAQIQEGMTAWRAVGSKPTRTWGLALLAEVYGKAGQTEERMKVLAEALATINSTGERYYEAELYRLKGELTLQKAGTRDWGLGTGSSSPQAPSLKPQVPSEVVQEAEGYFLKAIEIAQKQQAKSWELRAAMSLARLWQQQGKRAKAHKLLSEVYNWFTEGFDTKDLQEAKALLDSLESDV